MENTESKVDFLGQSYHGPSLKRGETSPTWVLLEVFKTDKQGVIKVYLPASSSILRRALPKALPGTLAINKGNPMYRWT